MGQQAYQKVPSRDDDSVGSQDTAHQGQSTLDSEALDFPQSTTWFRRNWPSILAWSAAQILFLAVYTAIVLRIARSGQVRCLNDVISSPASEAIVWRAQTLDTRLRQQDDYAGEPSPETDAAWQDLISLSNIKVPITSLLPLNKTSIPIPASPSPPTEAWASLGVTHELHCLSRLRMALFPQRYYPDLDPSQQRLNALHSLHCLDYLRQAAQCHGDVSLTTYYWDEAQRFPVADFGSPKACVDWGRLEAWQRERVWDPMEPGVLKHPTFGPAFPDGNGTLIGVTADQLHADHKRAV